MSFQDSQRPTAEDEAFYVQCRAAYLAVFKSSLANISSRQQLCSVMQQAGRNPSLATLSKYWTPTTSKLNFDDFCEILKSERKTEEHQLLKAFKHLDTNSNGYLTRNELEKVLTNRGDKMTTEEVNAVFSLADVIKDGKLDYEEFCRVFTSTVDQCQTAAMERLEADAKQKRQNFGSQLYSPPKNQATSASSQQSQALETPRSDEDGTAKTESQPESRSSSARSRRSSLSNAIAMTSSSSKYLNVQEPSDLQKWPHCVMKGCFFVAEDRSISSLQYSVQLPQTTNVYLTIQPAPLSNKADSCDWMSTDTALFVISAVDSTFIRFTEAKDKHKYVWSGELNAGVYHLLPFSSGCRLKKSKNKTSSLHKPKRLVYRTDSGELDLTPELREALSEIFEMIDLDGNGLLSREEYEFFELMTSGESCDKDAWAFCKENFDMRNNQLTKQGFLELNLMEATDKDGDPADLWIALEVMGYNRMLELVEACPFQIDVQCERVQPLLLPLHLESGTKLLNQAVHRSITANGTVKPLKGNDNVTICTYRGEHRISSLITNKTNQKVTVHVNNEACENCSSNRDMKVFAVEISGRTKMVGQHVLPLDENQDWTYNCRESIIPSI